MVGISITARRGRPSRGRGPMSGCGAARTEPGSGRTTSASRTAVALMPVGSGPGARSGCGARPESRSPAQRSCGRDRIRTCVGNAGDFTGCSAVTSRVLSCPYTVPVIAHDVHERPADSFGRHSASPPVPARPTRPRVGRRESGGKSCRRLALSSAPTWSAGCTAVPMSVLPLQAWAIRTTDTRRGPTGTARRFVLGL